MNIFLDCGTHKGEGLTMFYNMEIIDETYKVYCFEPIPDITSLEKLNEIVGSNGKKFGDIFEIEFNNSAIWISDGKIEFNVRNDHAAHVNGIGYTHEGAHMTKQINSVNLSKFVESLPIDANIICKMDIEGSEFYVLRDMICNGSIKRFNKLYVEFHPNLMKNESDYSVNNIIQDITKNDVELYLWF